MLSQTTGSGINVTTKWDGAPAIIAGINPENGKFFVGTKGVFSKQGKLNYTPEDIKTNHPGEGLSQKLLIALQYLPELGIKGVIQGDMMYTSADLKVSTIDGESLLTFQPNTIVYAVPVGSTLAKQIKESKMGIVWHTSYHGKTMADMQASFDVNIGSLRHSKNVWYRDASFVDATGSVSLSKVEQDKLQGELVKAEALLRSINRGTINQLSGNEMYRVEFMAWNNSKVREGQMITDTSKHLKDFLIMVEKKWNKNILEAKRDDTRIKRTKEKAIVMNFYRKNISELKKILDFQNILVDAKNSIIRKLQQVKDIGTFIKTADGFKVTAPEGFVAVNLEKGHAVKLIDRLEFSTLNFNVSKEWSK